MVRPFLGLQSAEVDCGDGDGAVMGWVGLGWDVCDV